MCQVLIAVAGPAVAMAKGHVPGPIATGQEHETLSAIAIGKKKKEKEKKRRRR